MLPVFAVACEPSGRTRSRRAIVAALAGGARAPRVAGRRGDARAARARQKRGGACRAAAAAAARATRQAAGPRGLLPRRDDGAGGGVRDAGGGAGDDRGAVALCGIFGSCTRRPRVVVAKRRTGLARKSVV